MTTQLLAQKIDIAQKQEQAKVTNALARAALSRAASRQAAVNANLQKVAVGQNVATAKALVNKEAAQKGVAQQNAETAVRKKGQQKKKAFKEAWKLVADKHVMQLANEQMAAWTKINPAYVAAMPGMDGQHATIDGKHGVAGTDFQAPSAPTPVVTAVTSTYNALHPKSGSAVSTYVESLVEETIPVISSSPKAQTVSAKGNPAQNAKTPWGKIGIGLAVAYLLLHKKQ